MKHSKSCNEKSLIGNIPFSILYFSDAEEILISEIRHAKTCRQVVIANVYSVVLAHKDPIFAQICKNADYVFADGLPVVWASRIMGARLPQRIAGPDFMWSFCQRCAGNNFSIFLLGANDITLSKLKANLLRYFPELIIAGTYSPPFGTWSDEVNNEMVNILNNSKCDVIWVGVSTPKQDKWIHDFKSRLNAKIALAVGAAFDFHSGNISRAPEWIQNAGLEWLYRLIQEPKRLWKRYLVGNFYFIGIIFFELLNITIKNLLCKNCSSTKKS